MREFAPFFSKALDSGYCTIFVVHFDQAFLEVMTGR